MGRECAKEGKNEIIKYQGKIEEYLKDLKAKWVEKAEFDEGSNEIRIQDKKRDKCFCPFVDITLMTKDFCNCSIGWQKENYETILEKKVDVKIDSSILRGADHCSFTIKILET